MMDNRNFSKLIEDYFEGNLSAADKMALESKISVDSNLRGEFEMQKDIINSIKDARRLELKARLDNIQVHWYHSVPGSLKIAAAISALTITSLSAFYLIDKNFESDTKLDLQDGRNTVEILAPTDNLITEKPAISISMEETGTLEPDIESTSSTVPKSEKVVAKKEVIATPEIEHNRDFEVFVPDATDEFNDVQEIDMEDMRADEMSTMKSVNDNLSTNVEIESIKNKKYTFHYKFDNGRLSLYGDFGENPYEILEINSQDGKRFYLKFKENFYPIKNTSEICHLDPVTDENLINELKIAEDNK